jgi:hypothetical protein
MVLYEDGWVWDTPIAIQYNGKIRAIPLKQRSRFKVAEEAELPLPAAFDQWDAVDPSAVEDTRKVKIFFVS